MLLTTHKNSILASHYIMNNECSIAFKEVLKSEQVTFEVIPSDQHRKNSAKRAIRTFTNHLLSGFVT